MMPRVYSLLLAVVWIAADYFSKIWAVDTLSHKMIVVNSWMNFRLAYNPGAAFSFLSNQGGWQRWFFAGMAVVISLWLIYTLLREWLKPLVRFGYASILGGAIGNLYDRIVHGHVIDFIQWHYQDYYWPIFNIADVAICVGVAAVILGSWFGSAQSKY